MKKLLNLDDDHFLRTQLELGTPQGTLQHGTMLLAEVKSQLCEYRDRRQQKESRMSESWGLYLNTEEAHMAMRAKVLQSTGVESHDWQHKIQDGLCFRTVETVVSYLMSALFPNEDWFELTPQAAINDEEYLLYLKVMKAYINAKLKQSSCWERVESFLRQLAICGTSGMALPWRFETGKVRKNVMVRENQDEQIRVVETERVLKNHPDLQVLDIFDFWFDPNNEDPNDANFVRRITMTRGEITRLIKDKHYDLADIEDIKGVKSVHVSDTSSSNKVEIDLFGGIGQTGRPADKIEVFEFWGNIQVGDVEYQDVVVTWVDTTLLRFETNPYWAGRPFVFANYTQVVNSPYGIGCLEPVRGLVHEKTSIKNQRLDAGVLSLNPMYEFINDGTFDVDGFFTEPGKMIPVSTLGGTLRPIQFDRGYHSISVSEEQSIGNDIEMTTGTGAFIGSSPGRKGERVTAQEVSAIRDAGGNRLGFTHSHIEEQFLKRFLNKYYQLCQQFQIEEEIIPVYGNSKEELLYVRVGIEQLGIDFYFTPMGAAYIADKEYELRNMLDWITAVNGVPEMATTVDWVEVGKELTKRFLGGNVERFLKKVEPMPEAPDNSSVLAPEMGLPTDPVAQGLESIGGKEMANLIGAQEQAVPGMLEASVAATGRQPALPPGIDPEQLQAALQQPQI